MHTTRRIITAAIIAAGPATANAAVYTQSAPWADLFDQQLKLFHNATNNDTGAVYSSAEFRLLRPLAEQIYALFDNASVYPSVEALMDDWTRLGFQVTSDVRNGWFASGYDPVTMENIGGLPDITYDQWIAGRTADLVTTIPLSQLTASGNAADWGDPDATYATITLTDTVVEDAFVGKTLSIGNPEFFADGFAYQLVIIPAPAVLALAPLGALATARRRR